MLGFGIGQVAIGEVEATSVTPTPTPSDILLGGGPGYEYPQRKYDSYDEERQKELLRQQHAELKRINEEIALAEQKRLEAQAEATAKQLAKKRAKQLALLEAKLQDEISGLRIMRIRLMRLIDDEETILVLLMRKKRRLF